MLSCVVPLSRHAGPPSPPPTRRQVSVCPQKSRRTWRKQSSTTAKPNYLVYDSSRKSPPGFAVRVGARAAIYLVEKMVRGKKLKIVVGLAWGKRGGEAPMPLDKAREEARAKIATAVKHGTNPNKIADEIEASELTFGMVWDRYIADLLKRARPIKKNSLDSINEALDKFKDWEDRRVGLITGQEVLDRFDLHFYDRGHKTAVEAMGRWATAAVNNSTAASQKVKQVFSIEPTLPGTLALNRQTGSRIQRSGTEGPLKRGKQNRSGLLARCRIRSVVNTFRADSGADIGAEPQRSIAVKTMVRLLPAVNRQVLRGEFQTWLGWSPIVGQAQQQENRQRRLVPSSEAACTSRIKRCGEPQARGNHGDRAWRNSPGGLGPAKTPLLHSAELLGLMRVLQHCRAAVRPSNEGNP